MLKGLVSQRAACTAALGSAAGYEVEIRKRFAHPLDTFPNPILQVYNGVVQPCSGVLGRIIGLALVGDRPGKAAPSVVIACVSRFDACSVQRDQQGHAGLVFEVILKNAVVAKSCPALLNQWSESW